MVTHRREGLPTSSSSQPSLMAAMLAQLDVGPGHRVLEIGTGTGYNAALLAELVGESGCVSSVELQPGVAAEAAAHLDAGGWSDVEVVVGDGGRGHAPGAPYDRVIVTAGAWQLARAWVQQLADGGVLVAPLRLNGASLSIAYRRQGAELAIESALHCAFMPLRGMEARGFRWRLSSGAGLAADVELREADRAWLDDCLAGPPPADGEPVDLGDGSRTLDALLWLGLQGRPLIEVFRPGRGGIPSWSLALLGPGSSALVFDFLPDSLVLTGARPCGGREALESAALAIAAWREAGEPGPERLRGRVRPGNAAPALPTPTGDGTVAFARGAHRHELWYVAP